MGSGKMYLESESINTSYIHVAIPSDCQMLYCFMRYDSMYLMLLMHICNVCNVCNASIMCNACNVWKVVYASNVCNACIVCSTMPVLRAKVTAAICLNTNGAIQQYRVQGALEVT